MLTRRRLSTGLRITVVSGLVAVIIAGLAGQVIRDRSVPLAILMYLPVIPAGLAAIAIDLAMMGRAIPHWRFESALTGIFGVACAIMPMIGSGTIGKYGPSDGEVTLLQWNVLWGGGPVSSPRTWTAQRAEILKRDPDLIILSELPPADWVDALVDEMGPGSNMVTLQRDPRNRLAVCSRWPIELEDEIPLPGGVGMSVKVTVRGRSLRLLVVDGKSNPFHSRLPFLRAIAATCRAAVEAGRPFDVVAGDFNTPSHSIGFDAMTAQGYALAGRSAAGWRGTFPSWLPLYDIDHVWSGPGLRLRSCTFFSGPYSDHRGQFVSLLHTETEATAAGVVR